MHSQILIDPINGQNSNNCCHSNSVKSKLGHNLNIVLVEIKNGVVKESAMYVIATAKVMSSGCVETGYMQLLIIIHKQGCEVGRREQGDKNGRQENDTCINISSN
jgi:hypothetical protein